MMTGVDGVELRQSHLDAPLIVGNEIEIMLPGRKNSLKSTGNKGSAATSINNSYKGNLTKLLRKARIAELE